MELVIGAQQGISYMTDSAVQVNNQTFTKYSHSRPSSSPPTWRTLATSRASRLWSGILARPARPCSSSGSRGAPSCWQSPAPASPWRRTWRTLWTVTAGWSTTPHTQYGTEKVGAISAIWIRLLCKKQWLISNGKYWTLLHWIKKWHQIASLIQVYLYCDLLLTLIHI